MHHLRRCGVSDRQIQAWDDRAETGYDIWRLPKSVLGCPPSERWPSVVAADHLAEEMRAARLKRVADEGDLERSGAV